MGFLIKYMNYIVYDYFNYKKNFENQSDTTRYNQNIV